RRRPAGPGPGRGPRPGGWRAAGAGRDEGAVAPVLAASAVRRGSGPGQCRPEVDGGMPAGLAGFLCQAAGAVGAQVNVSSQEKPGKTVACPRLLPILLSWPVQMERARQLLRELSLPKRFGWPLS